MTHAPTTVRRRAAVLVTALLALAACGGGEDTTTTPDEAPAATEAPALTAAPAATEAPALTAAPAATEAPAPTAAASPATDAPAPAGGDVVGAELVCPTVDSALALAADAGWGPGAGLTDDAAKASLSAELVIALFLDDNDQTQALWDAADAIAADGCPDQAAQLTAIYGSTTLLDILRAV